MGTAYIAKAFITVITGGAAMLTGTLSASAAAGHVSTVGHVPDHAGVRRGGAADRRHRAAAPAAPRHHRALPAAVACEATRMPSRSPRRCVLAVLRCAVWLPHALELFALINATVFVSMAVLALSLGLVWGFGGILCFGQTAFFGLGGYAYAVAAINFGDTTWAVPLALLVPTLAAAALGYLMFFGRISDVYMGVITLTVTLILFNFINSTAGDQWTHRQRAAGRLQRHAAARRR